jgi:hypothetical protein
MSTITKDLQPLYHHLKQQPRVSFHPKSAYTVVCLDGRAVTRLTHGKTGSATARTAISDLKRTAPKLLEGFEGPGRHSHKGRRHQSDAEEHETMRRLKKRDEAYEQKRQAVKERLDAAIALFGSKADFVRHVQRVGEELGLDSWSTVNSGSTALWNISHDKRISEKTLDLLDIAIDEAYREKAPREPVGKKQFEETGKMIVSLEEQLKFVTDQRDVLKRGNEVLEAYLRQARAELHSRPEVSDEEPRKRYLALLLNKAETSEFAPELYDRIEKLLDV